jgi:hypothetical protein
MLKPNTACREVVRQIQTLLRLQGRPPIDEGDSAYIQARQRLPRQRLEQALSATAQAAERRAGSGGQLGNRPVKVVDGSTTQLPIRPETRNVILNLPARNPVAVSPSSALWRCSP